MLKKTITYTSLFTDEAVTEDHYFHISKADLVEMEMEEHKAEYTPKGGGEKLTGMQAKLQRVIDSQDGKAIIDELKDIILRSYGKRDGDRFLKSRAQSEDFLASEAGSEMLFEICTNAEKSAEFINGIIPKNLEQITAEVKREAAALEEAEKKAPTNAIVAEARTGLEGDGSKPSSTMDALDKASNALGEGDPTVRTLTVAEATKMDKEELQAGLADGRFKLA